MILFWQVFLVEDDKLRRNWTRDELIMAFNLYCVLPFGKLHRLNPEIIKLSKLINRTPSAVALKLVNFASLDPELKKRDIKGMSSHSRLDKQIFDEFQNNWSDLVIESELLLNSYDVQNINSENNIISEQVKGIDKVILTKQRVNQQFFRKMVLSNYNLMLRSFIGSGTLVPLKANI